MSDQAQIQTPANENELESAIRDLGLNAPRLNPNLVNGLIKSADYYHFPGTTTTVCCITMINGGTVTGESACVSIENFNADIGRSVAFENAREKVWTIAGAILKDALTFHANEGRSIYTALCTDPSIKAAITTDDVKWIAEIAHEINRTYCASIGDNSQPAWNDAPDWQRESAINGVKFHQANPDATPEASHVNWLQQKELDGWRYGPVKNPETKEHPCYMPYHDLPIEQRVKDHLFRAVVHLLSR